MEIYKTNKRKVYTNEKYVIVLEKKEAHNLMRDLSNLEFKSYLERHKTILREIKKGLEKLI